MSLKTLITEAVVLDSMFDIESEMMSIKESILEQLVLEGVDDPGILKCVFMAGGPGSGKSFTAMEIFGIDKKLKSSFSATGLKSVNSDSAFEVGLKKNGIDPRPAAVLRGSNTLVPGATVAPVLGSISLGPIFGSPLNIVLSPILPSLPY